MKLKTNLIIAVTVLLAAGCAGSTPEWETMPLGDSARTMIEMQKLNPEATIDNAEKLAEGTDGERAEKIMEAYRLRVTSEEEGEGDVIINVGQ